MIAGLLDHLWQSSLFAGGAGLFALWLWRQPARLRFHLWFAASLKFLMPFAALSALGECLSRLFPVAVPDLVLQMRPGAERLSAPAQALAVQQQASAEHLLPLLIAIWLAGFGVVVVVHVKRWMHLRAVLRQAHAVEVALPVEVKASSGLLEPGLVGIFKPIVLLPEGLIARLSRPERDAILAHELGHFSRGDNITAAVHMLVEALFWFYPPVWLIGARLIAERERACDESVLAEGHDAEVYAQAILKVCRFCIRSPLACAAGASGANLGGRLRHIMADEDISRLDGPRKVLLTGALALALGLPLTQGFVTAPPAMGAMQERLAGVQVQVVARIVQAAVQMRRIASVPAPANIRHPARLKPVPKDLSPQEQRMAAAEPAPAIAAATPAAAIAPPPVPVPTSAPAANDALPARSAVKEALVALYPQGTGDPDAVTCRAPETLPGSRLPGPRVCETNREWASLRARHEDITPDGRDIILRDGREAHAGYVVLNCAVERVYGTGIINRLGPPGSCF